MVLPYHDDESIPERAEPDPDEAYELDRDHAAKTAKQGENDD